jgi:hypothetical protein
MRTISWKGKRARWRATIGYGSLDAFRDEKAQSIVGEHGRVDEIMMDSNSTSNKHSLRPRASIAIVDFLSALFGLRRDILCLLVLSSESFFFSTLMDSHFMQMTAKNEKKGFLSTIRARSTSIQNYAPLAWSHNHHQRRSERLLWAHRATQKPFLPLISGFYQSLKVSSWLGLMSRIIPSMGIPRLEFSL